MNAVGYKLTSGEVVIGIEKVSLEHTVELENLMQLVLHEVGEGRMGVGMQPFVPFSSGSITLDKHIIGVTFTPDDQIQKEYDRLFGTGLVLPDNKIIYH